MSVTVNIESTEDIPLTTEPRLRYALALGTKRGKRVLLRNVAREVSIVVRTVLTEYGCRLESISVKSNHLCLIVSAHPRVAPESLVKSIKRQCASVLRRKFPHLTKLPSLWSPGYLISTIGTGFSSDQIDIFLGRQRKLR